MSGSLKSNIRKDLFPPLPPPTQSDMGHHLHSQAESVLAGTAEVEDGQIRGVIAGDNGKESLIPVVEVLDEVRGIISAPHTALRQRRH